MNRRGTGTIFILIAAMLYSAKYISAAIFGSATTSWDEELFDIFLSYTGTSLHALSIIALISGIVYIGWAEIGEIKKGNSN
ncbi:hypothetical protein KQ939_15065 [Planococcus sp. CP5-4]|uniref:hypothetical protein n=1 Tax=unclassified Planococcus (in: firmicutes) TaxID=2662419 RepID=UPI001C24B37E|nr:MULTISPECIES: hypothetical protein [unclassified Planococcus (in: firmicutes)]MBU9674305.1 hypothetical protein [Planococcus sp. CP5-4_YE]MBV0909108.1 hypothetical protein [Planococcus sp. CP5-4_UN]MBW6064996.1 hypothetical protein [Planococcus sp. CP5-4]